MNNDIYGLTIFILTILWGIVHFITTCRIENLYSRVEKLEEQKPETGHWIYTLEDWNKWECSECGFTKRTDVHVSIGYDYCPKCGVKMIKEGGNRY